MFSIVLNHFRRLHMSLFGCSTVGRLPGTCLNTPLQLLFREIFLREETFNQLHSTHLQKTKKQNEKRGLELKI